MAADSPPVIVDDDRWLVIRRQRVEHGSERSVLDRRHEGLAKAPMSRYRHFNDHRNIELNMEQAQALDAFAALSQETRLEMVRALVRAGPEGLPAGTVAESVGVSSSSASFHLAHLERAGLVQSRREARSILYSASYANLSALVEFLMRDCCQGHPEVCAPAVDALSAAPCCPPGASASGKGRPAERTA